ncbi:MAG: hypothetical protein LBR32_00340 [Propionibacteriaceae bacterium]|jgi:hypothetical protein|nr:hypothetical protein [Propionibacteriaceae bacterium]
MTQHNGPRTPYTAAASLVSAAATIIFLVAGFVFHAWHPAWIVFPIAAILNGVLYQFISNQPQEVGPNRPKEVEPPSAPREVERPSASSLPTAQTGEWETYLSADKPVETPSAPDLPTDLR